MASKNKNLAELLDANGDVLLSNLDNVSVTPTAVSDQDNTSTGQFVLPEGTTAQRPVTSYTGAQRFNTDLNVMEYYNGTGWFKISAELAVLDSVTGNIYAGIVGSDLTLAGGGFLSKDVTVNFTQSSDGIDEDVVVTASSDTSATVTVPAAVYNNVTAGNVVTITVTNDDGQTSSGVSKTAIAAPSGGTITTSGDYRIHTFTSTGNFTNTIANLSTEYLIVAGGGGGGSDAGGGGGAGGMRTGTTTLTSTGTFTATVAAGGAAGGGGSGPTCPANDSNNGGNSSFNSITSTGGGKGGMGESRHPCSAGGNGGSGGGGGGTYPANDNQGSGGSGTSGQGNNGAAGRPQPETGGGGGGAGGAAVFETGGNGSASSITGSSVTYAGGGGGGGWSSSAYGTGAGGSGGGGDGGGTVGTASDGPGANGTANTGGGGGGGSQNSGGNGGSGIVIVRYDVTAI